MDVSIGTFNLNNLFSRYNFEASIDALRVGDPDHTDVSVAYEFDENADFVIRTYRGRLIKAKQPQHTQAIAARILSMDVDVLAVQEVEDIAVLRQFNRDFLDSRYPYLVLIEGNDPRLIDVGVLSRLPIGAITSFQAAVHPDAPDQRVFGRDLVGVEILNAANGRALFTLYNTHLKSHFVDYRDDPQTARAKNDLRRRHQAETVARLIGAQQRRGARFILTGDMNDPVDSTVLAPMLTIDGDPLVDALAAPIETRPAKRDSQGPGPQTPAWTYRHNPPGRDTPPIYGLYDQIWLSPRLADALVSAHIDRRTRHGGDGSDHDPAWIHLDL